MSNTGIDEQQFNAISAFLKSLRNGNSLDASDLNMLNNEILGVFSNTYTPKYIGKTPEQLMSDNAPDFFTVAQTGDQMLMDIASDIASGSDIWTVKQNIKKILAQRPVGTSDIESSEYLQQADTYYKQWNSYKKAEREDAQTKIDNDPFRKYGLPGFDERYDPEQMFAGDFEKTAQRFKDSRANSKMPEVPYENRAKQLAQSGKRPQDSGATTNPVGGKLNKIPSSTPQEYVDTATSSVNDADKELTAATAAFENFKKNNPDDFGMEYQDKYDRVQNALKNQGQRIDTAVGFTGAGSYTRAPATSTAPANDNSVGANQKPYFDREKAKAASGLSKEYEDSVRQAMIDILANKLATEGKTPLKDALTARGLFASSANTPKAKATKNYTVKGSQVVPMSK